MTRRAAPAMPPDVERLADAPTPEPDARPDALPWTEAAGVAGWTYEVATRVLDCSPLCRAMHGVGPDEPVTIELHDRLIHPDDRAAVQSVRAAAMDPTGSGHYRVEFRFRFAGGDERWIESVGQTAFAETADGRRATQVVGAMIDVTARKRAEEERERLLTALRDASAALAERTAAAEVARAEAEAAQDRAERAGREAEQANRAKSAFLATMSHELRTPLNAIVGYTQLLDMGLAGPLTEQQASYLGRLAVSGRHLLGLVDDVLDLSRIEAGEARVAHHDAWTGAAVRGALDLVRPQADARGVRLVDARPDDDGVPYVGDEARVRQIVLNLLSNAVKFTEPGGTVSVTCDTAPATPAAAGHLRGEGPWAFVRVADSGMGIPPEQQGRIFEPFHQVDAGHTRRQGGTGLGLAISRRLARLMGGDLTVESTPGEGSTFTLWLPAARRDGAAQTESADARTARAARALAQLDVPGLGEVGEALRGAVDEVVGAYADRLRVDPAIPRGRGMQRVQLEDHAVSLLADLAQSLAIVGDAGAEAAELLHDGSAIQRTIAEHHGARRHAQGWDEAAVRRDHRVFREEVERAVRSRRGAGGADVEAAMAVLLRLIDRAEGISIAAWRQASQAAAAARGRD